MLKRRVKHERRHAAMVLARTLHGPVEMELNFVTSRRSLQLESTVAENEMRGKITVTLGAGAETPVTGIVTTADSGHSNITGHLQTDGAANLRLADLELYTRDLATPAYTCLRRGGFFVDLIGSNVKTAESSLVRAYCMLSVPSHTRMP